MTSIAIRFQQKTEAGFTATLSFDDGAEYAIAIAKPFSEQEERRLEWYFERWIHKPYTDTVKAEQARQSILDYGESLFDQVFADRAAYSEYRQVRGNLSQVTLEILGDDPTFQALHWETLRDPELGDVPLAVNCVMLRRINRKAPIAATLSPAPVINVLLVTARPGEESDLNYRTTSRPLMAAIANARLPVNLVLLRPGTYEALDRHLAETPAGFYHIVHFDCHGGVMDYELLRALDKNRQVLLKGRYGGRPDVQPFAGERAFLFLETETKGKSDPVEAEALANLLKTKQIPVCILDACQLGQEVDGQEAQEDSLGSRLMLAGMQLVVAMRYSVMASAAGMLMQQFYQQMAAGKPLLEAMRLGRRELFNQKSRKAYFNQQVDLEDWLLPVLYCNQPNLTLAVQARSAEQEEAYWMQQESLYRFPEPTYGFVGRDLEILKIEKALLRHNVLLVQGMGGTGKTTLLNYLRLWWQQTNFVAQTFYFGYDQKAWTLEQILFAVGKAIYSRFEQASFQAMGQGAQMMKLVVTLRAGCPTSKLPYALILDNLESVTGQELAIPNTLPTAEQEKIRDFLGRLMGGRTYVVLGSRSDEAWLRDSTFRQAVYLLKGLDPESRSALAEKILRQVFEQPQRVEAIRKEPEFLRLMKLLAGYPLAMEVVLANLRRQTPSEILAGLDAADVGLDTGSEDKTKSILKCVEYSHSNLSAASQRLLLCLAPFSGFIDQRDLPNYAQELQQLVPFQAYDFGAFEGAIEEAIHWGLLSPLREDLPQLLTIQPVFPYFLKTKLSTLDEATREALQTGFKQHYQGLAGSYKQWMDSKNPQERQLGIQFCQWEYENLFHALQICLDRQESFDISFCLKQYFDLINDKQSNLKLLEFVCQKIDRYPTTFLKSAEGYQIPFAIARLGRNYLEAQQYEPARAAYQRTLDLYEQIGGVEDQQKQLWKAVSYHQLGSVDQELREYEQARVNYQRALEIKIEFGDRYSQADTYHQLGSVDQELREYEQARVNYQQALEIKIEFGDRYSQAGTYHQLGIVDQELREYEQARVNYQQALEIYIEFGDRYSQADTYHQLGIVDQELREYEQARVNYQQALEIKIEFGDRYSQARTYHQLGSVDQELREYEQARVNYQQALEIKIEFGDRYSQARTYAQLGLLAEELKELPEAQANFLQALQIFAEYNDQHMLGIVMQILARFYRANPDPELAAAVAQIFGCTVEEAREAIESWGQGER
ncbi:MAG: tetratricopeptide repeat protein [Drouetiella hepatica Uher 2000/2452]|jgi:tetratricopeptide (TPR) repeat protein|uniref:Tetratricopeptide repeat protein n=1 Tax=Drouetiella hepatica Uher 2000/2452 TaxID=904376 RepID=A0A951UMD3_9CYAN|nr:tetratricopeptide repeat protein [Drouetiella hepatica Uher 2000/2452]